MTRLLICLWDRWPSLVEVVEKNKEIPMKGGDGGLEDIDEVVESVLDEDQLDCRVGETVRMTLLILVEQWTLKS